MKKLFYFAFGSNMFTIRLDKRVGYLGAVKAAGTHRLKDYALVFNAGYGENKYANIVPAKGNYVEGVLYELNDKQINVLNQYEGYPYNYQQSFFVLPDGNVAFAYVSADCYPGYPSKEYLNVLIAGAHEHNLSDTVKSLIAYQIRNDANIHKASSFKISSVFSGKRKKTKSFKS